MIHLGGKKGELGVACAVPGISGLLRRPLGRDDAREQVALREDARHGVVVVGDDERPDVVILAAANVVGFIKPEFAVARKRIEKTA